MKSTLITLIACLLLTVSCEKDSQQITDLTGKWEIKKMLADPGNGSGRYQNVPENSFISFNEDGSATSNYQGFGIHLIKSYRVADTAKIIFSFKDLSSQPTTSYRYRFSGDTLELNPPCIEGCGLKLVKAN